MQPRRFYCFCVLATALVLGACNDDGDKPMVHFHGKFSALTFCEGDDGELISQDGMLQIACADQRKTQLSYSATDGDAIIYGWMFDCRWCRSGVRVGAGGLALTSSH